MQERARRTWLWWVLGTSIVVLGAVIWIVDGRPALEKLLLRLTTPFSLVWIGLAVAMVVSLRRRQQWTGKLLVGCWLLLTLGGNGWVATALIRPLEADFIDVDPLQEAPVDAVVILGGGLTEAVGSRIQVNRAGDRIVLGARLYHAGRTPKVYCTGTRIASLSPEHRDPSSLARVMLAQLGVADEDILETAGINTSEEFRHLAGELPEDARVGLITSAWHMPRALRLAESQGLHLVPLPADFVTPLEQEEPPGPARTVMSLLPSSGALSTTEAALKEYLANAVGR